MIAAADLLSVWESGVTAGNAQRAALLHAVARPDVPDLLAVPVGERDAELFALRRSLFGRRIPVLLACAECDEELEFDFDTMAVPQGGSTADPITVTEGPWSVVLRVPTCGDVLAAARSSSPRDVLLARCVLEAKCGNDSAAVTDLPADVVGRVVDAAAQADPGADIQLAVRCPECDSTARAELDISVCLWTELDAWARATLLDVAKLAASFGWTEADILAMSPLRRRYYLELAGHA
ncbi:T4 family baseplate hub assembly chaperone [Kibdelosporangium aridum]|uniref:T4 family baseplate hub assembly chaperone n=1 Tax=Kibdelosporangium aridum TaxID=2030 RepID=UPI000526E9D8